ncbi:hypothetical protein MJO28_002120 [Puccinia striiformis f. sp. tritici]|uniref:Peptidase S8/S53 domain-containing protein n=2 Tax=Puccinia striiformis f. sp. tritici TaxID=168172 RepID=A0A0L0W367_9BASI|nr:hypothetical protein Pst134EA_002643 [Puccinia striiformis f. sp. tritici]KAI9610088.1 hypothetical protein H4Q26_007086 [Puccinia striiformis f. sp. tritici PST-130]KNF05939.1 hypothetical protein PSTG_00930 [Puccinia striiformis f. sp. tritici PST-78]KAH9464236.1 hypothetical protein Pst134EB_003768 [Puccinia striiformis f. sp. tritici]KAH9472014.1 hypothetical protein Pst134EA_002643 [Puccinia striiformis f. sp. tritici]KAI7961631.1 hypothetical protein MJO28_002120 [Puccinia striiformis
MVSLHQLLSLTLVILLILVSNSHQGDNSKPSKNLPHDQSKPSKTPPRDKSKLAKNPPPHKSKPSKDLADDTPPRYLVSLNPKNKQAVEDLSNKLNKLHIKFRIVFDLTKSPDVFYGVSLELLDKSQAKLIQGVIGVQDVKQVGMVTRGPTFGGKVLSKPLTTTVEKFPPHLQTNISMLHNRGIYGKGIKVALVDSGIDCTHPAFGGGFGPGKKIAFGRSFVENDDAQAAKNKGAISNPCSDCSHHGTHTAGIIGAADVGYGFQGVAPNVTLGMYPFGCGVGSTDDVVIQALLQAQIDGADIISLSLGSPGGWSYGKEILKVVDNLVENKGILVFASAGNEGTNGLFSSSSPASSRAAIAVGSVDSSSPMARSFNDSSGKELTYYRNEVLPDATYPVYFTSKNLLNEDDCCSPLPESTPDLSKFIVFIKIGSCFISEKVHHARAKGAKLIFLYMKSRVIVSMHSEVLGATMAGVSLEDAQYIAAEAKKKPTGFHLVFNTAGRRTFVLQPGLESPFSQFGPNYDFKSPEPAISGIGGNVVSTYPMVDGAYSSLSGTSMSAPQLAGIAALILSHRGKKGFDGYSMRDRLTTSSRIINYSSELHKPHTVVHQGGGLINAWCAVMANTIVPNATLALLDSVSFKPDQQITISNTGTKAVQYSLTHLPAVSVKTFATNEKFNRPDVTPDTEGKEATAVMTPQAFKLAPGAKQVVKIRFAAPKTSTQDLTVYSGYIVMNGDLECESHNVPYYGVVGSLKDQEIIDRGPIDPESTINFPYLAFPSGEVNELGRPKFTVQAPNFVWKVAEESSLFLRFRTLFGSPITRVDVIAATANPVPSKTSKASDFGKSFGGAKLIGMVPGAEFLGMSRSPFNDYYTTTWDGTTVTGSNINETPTFLPNGKYKLLIRALRVNGRQNVEGDFDFWVSVPFELIR